MFYAGEMLTELSIRGMTCASCAAHVARALRAVPGVEDAAVNLATERATVQGAADAGALIAAVEEAGYEASTELDEERQAREAAAELQANGRMLVLALLLCVPTLALAMLAPAFPFKNWLLALLTLPVWLGVGFSFHRSAVAALRAGAANMDTLVSLGSTAAYALSCYEALSGGTTYFASASAIVTLIFAGKYLEARARARSSRAMRALLSLRPALARRRRSGGTLEEVPVELVRVGDELVIPPGEHVPVDGIAIEGSSAIDRSMLTGESMPIDVRPGSPLEAGTLNTGGALVMRAEAVGAGTRLAQIVEIVRRAQGSTPPVQRLADRAAGAFVPIIIAIAILTLAGWVLLAHRSGSDAIVAAVAVLVVACPCALGLATPTAIIAGVGAAARSGVLFKDASALERAARVGAVLFDKTGTITQGAPSVDAASSDDALALAAAVESASTHPLARAIVAAAHARALPVASARDVREERGVGVTGFVGEHAIAVGAAESNGTTRLRVTRDGAEIGSIELHDAVRPEARAAVERLEKLGIRSEIVSGDAEEPVREAALATGIARFHARVSPEGKAEIVHELRESGEHVGFAGDGINDAPALASADIGFAMGTGSAVALETAGAALLSNDPRSVADAIAIARATMRTVRQNLFWAFAYNVVLVPLAVFGIVRPVFAAAAMGLSSLFVVLNALRLARFGR